MDHRTLTPTHLINYHYCPRFTYFQHVLQLPKQEDRRYKVVKGRELHQEKAASQAEYLRRRIGVQRKQVQVYLTGHGLRGEIDEVLWLADGNMAPLDFKFAQYKDRVYSTYRTQLVCYALLIEENFGSEVEKGFLVYTRSRHKLVEVPIGENDKMRLKDDVDQIFHIIESNYYPKGTKVKKRCVDCTYRNVCIR
ncbi:CRISPR-associated protein Cas4 [Pontibacter sp. G13]|uniref:CRISPR-associated protein Cas4 n=1 Tax=Pontibacter sp. G13 TaxID=3074898 RepID=UPI00288BFFDB|nr:CRISPR-associated protein Cas4 [Pontibacter sp. G13]WNJ18149.1 CRISPR-associated protein Cas4 [Pontibacter sp. G13]